MWPATGNITYLFLLGLLLPAYTITGFDASAHTAEETINASRAAMVWFGIERRRFAGQIGDAARQRGAAIAAAERAIGET